MKVYDQLDKLPSGQAKDTITEGTLVLEGGGWKGLYTLGVLDAMMENDLNFSSVVGVSAGALSAMGYVSGQIGWGARIDLTYRHDKNYCGIGALRRDHGITGFSYLYDQILKDLPIDEKRLNDPKRQLVVSATNLENGEVEYFEKGKCDIYQAVQASASVPYVTAPVMIDGNRMGNQFARNLAFSDILIGCRVKKDVRIEESHLNAPNSRSPSR